MDGTGSWQGGTGDPSLWIFLLAQILPCCASDILKTNVPWKVLSKAFEALRQRLYISRNLLLLPSLQPEISTRLSRNSSRFHKSLFSNEPGLRQGRVQGIANFGQTCFMNSVLQSLASLEPIMMYLDRIVQVSYDQKELIAPQDEAQSKDDTSAAHELLHLLLMINGIQETNVADQHHQFRVDPRGLLTRIGKAHKQFKHRGEQQDAQEYLQALLAVIISEAHLDSTTAVSDYMQFVDMTPREQPLTAVVAAVDYVLPEHSDDSYSLVGEDHYSTEADCALSLSEILERIDEGQKSKIPVDSSRLKPRTTLHDSSDCDVGGSLEEKKQEDFEVEFHVAPDKACKAQNKVPTSIQALSTSSLSEASWDDASMAMKIVQSSISSITPSPLSGWLGSTIQCCKCQHVKPIRNSPFLNIPLVPTSVPAFLGTVQKNISPPNHPNLPPCTIEECLADFTSVERVQDVECRNCSLQAAVVEAQEEEMLLRGALESTERRIKARGGDPSTGTKSLQEELRKAQIQLRRLQTADPDAETDEDIFSHITTEDEIFLGDDISFAANTPIARGTARKCLFLTRCPAVLCCHIQRRFYNPYRDCMEKCTQKVLFDEYLNLAPYCTYSSEASSSWVAGTCRPKNDCKGGGQRHQMLYRLASIIEHRGNAHGGHYICYRRFGSSWFRISDKNVSPVPWNHVRGACEAYMLFYEAI